jgi:hypothetical protein
MSQSHYSRRILYGSLAALVAALAWPPGVVQA